MPVIRKIEIRNFRGIASLEWLPSEGINCLIGPGDSCKTTILDAIDLCLSARRNLTLHDADFHGLDVSKPVTISVTLGKLQDVLKNLETYGLYLRGFDARTGALTDEPDTGFELSRVRGDMRCNEVPCGARSVHRARPLRKAI